MKDRRLLIIGLAAVVLLVLWRLLPVFQGAQREAGPVVGDVPASEAREYTFDVGGDAHLEFAEVAGSIVVNSGPPGLIKAIVTKHSFGTTMESALREVQSFDVQPRQRGGTVSFALGSAARPRRRVDYKITTPPQVSLRVSSGSGSITIGGLRGSVDIAGDNVSVMLLDNRGPISIRNKAGDLRVTDSIGRTLIRSQASTVQVNRLTAEALDIDTGGSTVIRDTGTDASATLQVTNGDLTLTGFRAKTLRADVPKGRINISESQAEKMDLQTQVGKISLLRVSADHLQATTTTGQVEMDQTQGDLAIETQNGAVILTDVAPTGLHVAAGTGNVTFDGRLPQDGEPSVTTSSGGIGVSVAKESAFRLDAATSGSISIDPPFVLQQAERRPGRWRGVVNQGTTSVALKSATGDIWISPK